jgi:hypothetical protein
VPLQLAANKMFVGLVYAVGNAHCIAHAEALPLRAGRAGWAQTIDDPPQSNAFALFLRGQLHERLVDRVRELV